jgi:hypothetical protein
MNVGLRTLLFCTITLSTVLSGASGLSAVIDVSGTITGDTTWTGTDTIHLTDTVTVTQTGHLTILPGTVIQGDQFNGFHVQGQFTAIGENDRRVLFTCRADTSGGAPVAGGWSGIWFDEGSVAVMRHCDMRYADRAVYVYVGAIEIDSCLVENFLDRGIYIDGGQYEPRITPVITNSIIRQTDADLQGTGSGIYTMRLADATISHCQAVQCRYGMTFGASGPRNPHFQVSDCEVSRNASIGIYSFANG